MPLRMERLDLLPVKQRIAEDSAKRMAKYNEDIQIEREERQEEANIRQEERQIDRQDQLRSDQDEMKLKDLEQKTSIAGLDNPFARTTSRTTAPAYSPEAETIKRELKFQEYDTPERIEYLEGMLAEEAQLRPERVRSDIARAEGLGEPPADLVTPEGREAWRKVERVEKAAKKKKAVEFAKAKEEQDKILGNMQTWVDIPSMQDSNSNEVLVDTAEEAYTYFTEQWGYDEEAVRAAVQTVDWPAVQAKAGTSGKVGAEKPRTEADEISYQKKLSKAKRTPPTEKKLSRQEQAFEALKKGEALPGLTMAQTEKLGGVRIEEKGKSGPTFTQQQKIDSLKADLVRGRGSMQTQFGEPQPFEIESLSDALDVISRSQLDPKLFEKELKQWAERDTIISQIPELKKAGKVVIRDKQGNLFAIPKSQLKQAKKEGYELVKK